MKQVVQSARGGDPAVVEVPAPKVRDGHILVRTRASLISAGTERMTLDFARKGLAAKARARPDLVAKVLAKARRDGIAATWRAVLARLDEPLPLGYSAAGEVVVVGRGLEGLFGVGQRVAVGGAGIANHAELNLVPRNLAAPIPEGVPYEEACFATLAAIAMHAVRNLEPALGDVVAVIGTGLVGQLAVQILGLGGARVVAIDTNPERRALARRTGAELALDPEDDALKDAIFALTGGRGCDSILVAAASDSSEPLALAARIARDRARISLVGLTGTAFPYREFMQKELAIVVSRSYGPGRYDDDFEGRGVKYPVGFVRWTEAENLAESVRLMAPGLARRLDVKPLITHRFDFERAADAYALIGEGREPYLGVVLAYTGEAPAEEKPTFAAAARPASGRCVVGMIGAGNFAQSVLLPELKALEGVELHTLVTRKGAQAARAKDAAGFAHAATDEAAVLENPAINAVVVATRHDSHAALAVRALAAGKCVFVEKPLALSREELARIAQARRDSAGFLQVGFNRRFAPMAERVRALLARSAGPRLVVVRVNAGRLPADSWVYAPDAGGGRVLGEVCHFVDLARFLVGAPIASVQAEAAGASAETCEDVSVTLRFAGGSLATIVYTALGDAAAGKERIEAYAGGSTATIEDFRRLTVSRGGRRTTRTSRFGQDKGFRGELAAFAAAVATGGPAPVDESEILETSLATIAVLESLQGGTRIEL